MPPGNHTTGQHEREAAAVRSRAAQIQRETEQSLRNAHKRTRSAVAAVLAEQRHKWHSRAHRCPQSMGTFSELSHHRRARDRRVHGLVHAVRERRDRTARRRAGSAAQRRSTLAWGRPTTRAWRTRTRAYIEREQACVASFGTIADTQAERLRVWDAIGRTDSRGKPAERFASISKTGLNSRRTF